MDGVQLSQGSSHFQEAVYFLPLSFQKLLVLILPTLEGWKAESTLEPHGGFEHRIPELGIQYLSHYVIAPQMLLHAMHMQFIQKANETDIITYVTMKCIPAANDQLCVSHLKHLPVTDPHNNNSTQIPWE